MLKHQPERVGHALCGFCYCLDVPRAAEKEGGAWRKAFLREVRKNIVGVVN